MTTNNSITMNVPAFSKIGGFFTVSFHPNDGTYAVTAQKAVSFGQTWRGHAISKSVQQAMENAVTEFYVKASNYARNESNRYGLETYEQIFSRFFE